MNYLKKHWFIIVLIVFVWGFVFYRIKLNESDSKKVYEEIHTPSKTDTALIQLDSISCKYEKTKNMNFKYEDEKKHLISENKNIKSKKLKIVVKIKEKVVEKVVTDSALVKKANETYKENLALKEEYQRISKLREEELMYRNEMFSSIMPDRVDSISFVIQDTIPKKKKRRFFNFLKK